MDLQELKVIYHKNVQPQGTSGKQYCTQHLSLTQGIHLL